MRIDLEININICTHVNQGLWLFKHAKIVMSLFSITIKRRIRSKSGAAERKTENAPINQGKFTEN